MTKVRRKRSRGQSLVEFALVMAPLMFVVATFVDAARFVFYWNSLAEAARAGARYAIVHGQDSSSPETGNVCSSTLQGIVRGRVASVKASDVSVSCAWPYGGNSSGNLVEIQASMTFVPFTSQFVGGVPITIYGKTQMTIVY